MKSILLLHRYLAVAVGLLMSLWCLSGFVMMYQSYPELSAEQRLRGLEPLDLSGCCELGAFSPHDDTPASRFRIEMLGGGPVLRTAGANGTVVRLDDGRILTPLSGDEVQGVARRFAAGHAIGAEPRSARIIDIDQWTVASARRNRPVWQVVFDDAAGSKIYVNGTTGEVFQYTTRRERLLSWFGAIPHWLYPTRLRQDPALWTGVVIWASILGIFLAATGLYVGIQRLRRTRTGRLASPFRGWWYWHHMSGLLFGVLVLTWVFSGLMTMNPWGALRIDGGNTEYRDRLTGTAYWWELRRLLRAIDRGEVALPDDVRQLTPAVFSNRLYVLALDGEGGSMRLDREGRAAALGAGTVASAVDGLGAPVAEAGLMEREDSYYYGHKQEVPLPVYRVIMNDRERTRLYIDPATGITRSLGSTGRWSRWIRTGLHDMDFPVLRLRPLWDIVVGLLLAGVSLVSVTGTWMAMKRISRDYRALRGR